MKKTIILFLFSMFCMIVQGQTHMKFMGIPLNGSVEMFTQKLKAKGVICNVGKSKLAPSGAKICDGPFMGQNSEFMVFFNTKDRNVFSVLVTMEYSSLDLAYVMFERISNQLKEKYPNAVVGVMDDSDGAPEGLKFSIPDERETKVLGFIFQKLVKPDGYMTNKYGISLLYSDVANFQKSEERNNEDL